MQGNSTKLKQIFVIWNGKLCREEEVKIPLNDRGFLFGDGDFDFNIAIRTLVMSGQEIDIQLGGGIVADSQPDKKYAETLQKGASIFKALDVGALING